MAKKTVKKESKKIKSIKKTKKSTSIEEIQNINLLKIKYEIIKEKFNLPDYDTLNNEFDIGKVDINEDTILRDIRKGIITKLFSILSFTELLLNPSSGSMFYFYLVRGLDNKDKDILKLLFDKLGEIEIQSFKLDINYSENQEAKFIKEKSLQWENDIKPKLSEIIDKLEINWKKIPFKKEKSYFG